MQQIAKRLNCEDSWVFEDPWQALEKATVEAFEKGRFDDLLKGAVLKLRQRPVNEYQTPSGKIELYSSKALEMGVSPLPVQFPLNENEGWFTLLNSSLPSWTHSQFRDVYGPIPAIVWINPIDAASLGITNEDDVVLFNELGALIVEAIITKKVSKGVLWSPRPLIGKDGVPLNSLTSNNPQILGAGPRFNSTKVKIRLARA
jgi:anaerobic selenocysteine-containing dehydrogenase